MAEDLRTWEAWHTRHQVFELEWWRDNLAQGHSRDDKAFNDAWREIREWINPRGLVVDIGCGPRPPFAPCIAIDPLADRYLHLDTVKAEWWKDVVVRSQPAEIRIFQLHEEADTVICWNCLDHTIGWRDILDNMLDYGRPDARFAIATDFYPPFLGHPGYDRAEFMTEIEQRFEITERREPFGRQLALLMKKR